MKLNKKIAAIIVGGSIGIVGLGSACAFMLTHSSSTFTNNAGTVTAPAAVLVTGKVDVMDHSSDTWTLGGTESYYVLVKNTSAVPAEVGSVTLSGFTSNQAGCNSTALPGTFTAPAYGINAVLNPGATNATTESPFTVSMIDTGVDQTACAGAVITLDWASN